eukprot:gene2783-5480_t
MTQLPVSLDLNIIFEDSYVIAIHKPCEMLSVPGKVEKKLFEPRFKEWERTIDQAQHTDSSLCSSQCLFALKSLSSYRNIPRKQNSFYSYIERTLKITDLMTLNEMWTIITKLDEKLHKTPLSSIPLHFISATELLEKSHGKIYNVHRLDCATSGLLLFARNAKICANLCHQFRERQVLKIYIAEVMGTVSSSLRSIDLAMRPDPNNKPKQVIDMLGGKTATTAIKVIKYRKGLDGIHDTTVVQLTPLTGRTHQLRLHMASVGHPMLGDTLYVSDNPLQTSLYPTLRLHALSLSITHPQYSRNSNSNNNNSNNNKVKKKETKDKTKGDEDNDEDVEDGNDNNNEDNNNNNNDIEEGELVLRALPCPFYTPTPTTNDDDNDVDDGVRELFTLHKSMEQFVTTHRECQRQEKEKDGGKTLLLNNNDNKGHCEEGLNVIIENSEETMNDDHPRQDDQPHKRPKIIELATDQHYVTTAM